MKKYPSLFWDSPEITYNNIVKHLDKLQELLVIKFNLLNLFDDNNKMDQQTYLKLSDRILDIMPYATVAVYICNQYEEYEFSQKIYDKMKDIYVYGFSRLENNNHNLELEFQQLFSETLQNIEEAIKDEY